MAQKVQIILEDDLDGGAADETVTFGLDGTTYEIDLTSANAEKLRDALAPYVGHGRKVGRAGGRPARKASSNGGTSPAEIRAWAKSNGYDVPERGRIPANVKEAFDAAN
ncbi:histone-like nucleoid-structuring protein Lsr2 [Nocardioides sp. Kera G14]|uniref:histone-like nucleoid-structuring protein Lsr2 n=1 Tax=Nocardioides sp. Kera G14 TaxID=2884264 RepID=UPI001D10BDA9|nr:Lsr2 family protein [Nocardioides sp. Kera G14]UDY23855.1 Lsr2 family protein [Nocardioides sp. Kera G14]